MSALSNKSIILVRSDARLAGPGVLMLNVAETLRAAGWDVTIATGGGEMVAAFQAAGFTHHTLAGLRIGDRSALAQVKGALALRLLASKRNVAIIHSFNAQAGVLGLLATFGRSTKVINTVLGAGKERLLAKLPFRLIAVSDFVRRSLIGFGIDAERIDVVHNSILPGGALLQDRAQFDALWDARMQAKQLRLISIAMMSGNKGQMAILIALRRLLDKTPDFGIRIKFIGDGQYRSDLERFAIEQKLDGHVEFVGAINDVYPHLDAAHGLIHLTPQETFGIVIAEAQARGLGVIAYRIGGIPEVATEGESGILLDLDDIDGVVAAIEQAADLQFMRDMGWAGLLKAKDAFTRPRLRAGLEAAYEKL